MPTFIFEVLNGSIIGVDHAQTRDGEGEVESIEEAKVWISAALDDMCEERNLTPPPSWDLKFVG